MQPDSVQAPWWGEVWIVAGGSSCARFDFSRLSGKQVLCVNEAIFLSLKGPSRTCMATAVFSADPDWVGRRRPFLEIYAGEKYACLALDAHPECAGISGMTYLQRAHFNGLAENSAFLCMGGNSGYAAINLAVHKRVREIHLVGYDMNPADDVKYEQWIPRFRTMLPQLNARSIKVVNHNKRSFIDAFPKEL